MTENITFKYKITSRESGYAEGARILDEMKFVHVIDGSAVWNINGKDYDIKKDDIIVFSKNDTRYIKNVTSKNKFTVEQIVFLPITLYPMQNCADFFFERPNNFSNVIPKTNPHYEKLIKSFVEISNEMNNNYSLRNEYVKSVIVSMVINASRIFACEDEIITKSNNSQYETVCKAISYINNNLQNDLSRENIANNLYISPSYLSKIFKEYSGICLQDYIIKARVQKSIQLIKEGYRPIDAAFESGFSSTSGFYRAFNSVTGKKPKDILII